MKRLILFLSMLVLFNIGATAQTLSTTTFSTANGNLPGVGSNFAVPVDVASIGNVFTLTIYINYDPEVISYTGTQNPLVSGITVSNQATNIMKIIVANFPNPTNINDGKLIDLMFDFLGGNSDLTFRTTTHGTYISNILLPPNYTTFNFTDEDVTNGGVYGGYIGNTIDGGDWAVAANWNLDSNPAVHVVPNAFHNVTVDDGAKGLVTISADAVANDLTIVYGGQLTLDASTTLTVGGDFLIESESTGTGSFIQNGTLTVTGTSTVQQYVTGSSYQDIWHLMGIPVDEVGSYQTFLHCYLKTYNETAGEYQDVQADTNAASNVQLNTPMVGYSVGYAINGQDKLIDFNGTTLLTGDQSIAFTFGYTGIIPEIKGFNLFGNPYASSIDWNSVDDPNYPANLNKPFYVWDSPTKKFLHYLKDLPPPGNTASQYIPPCQGFFLEATGAGTFALENLDRVHQLVTSFYKDENTNYVTLKTSGNDYSDQITVWINENSTVGFDRDYDVTKMFGDLIVPSVYSITDYKYLAVNTLPTFDDAVSIGFKVEQEGQYTITAENIETFDISTPIFLEDLKENTVIDLRENPVYDFAYETGDDELRFRLHFKETFGINEITDSKVNIFSLNNIIYINLSEEISGDIFIYNLMGQEVSRSAISGLNNEIVLNVPNAYYVVKVVSDDTFVAKKVFLK